ncbi:MAG TPA: phosphatase PAP2 family protein [Tepidiformaceae bacterium]|nr:phosphatase PAP2 family protein [Tepidiformaceae bacterium]
MRDAAVVLSVITIYFLVRGTAPERTSDAVSLTNHLVAFEKATGMFWEADIQEWSIQSHAVKEFANFVYAYLHFPVLAVVAIWLRVRDRDRFLFVRNVMFISMALGIAFYYAFPAAPPRLMALHGYDLGFVDTVFGGDTAVTYAQPSLILNEYAAIPSFHFGWIALASAAIWTNTESRAIRAAALLLTLVMTWAIVASANHLFVDMALGGLVIAFSWRLAAYVARPHPVRHPVRSESRELAQQTS